MISPCKTGVPASILPWPPIHSYPFSPVTRPRPGELALPSEGLQVLSGAKVGGVMWAALMGLVGQRKCWASFPSRVCPKTENVWWCTWIYIQNYQGEYNFIAISSGLSDAQIFPSHGMGQAWSMRPRILQAVMHPANAAARPCDATSIPAQQGHGDMFQDGPWFLSGSVMWPSAFWQQNTPSIPTCLWIMFLFRQYIRDNSDFAYDCVHVYIYIYMA